MPHQYYIRTCQNPLLQPGFAAVAGAEPEEAYQPERPDSLTERAVTLPSPRTPLPLPCTDLGMGIGPPHAGNGPSRPSPTSRPSTTTWQASRVLCARRGRSKNSRPEGFSLTVPPACGVVCLCFSAQRLLSHFPCRPNETFFFGDLVWANQRSPPPFLRHRRISTHSSRNNSPQLT